MNKKMKVDDFLKTIPFDNIAHTNCFVAFNDKGYSFAYVKAENGLLLRTYNFKNFWLLMQKIDKTADELKIRVTVKTPLFRKYLTDDFTTFNVGA